ncbi:YheC/YheD family protein [Staphylococcus aureus]|uniref:YheC/YheD family protein n=1 Tax=Staphylococcus aureus TaxID=1280 RepID=UPI0039BEA700
MGSKNEVFRKLRDSKLFDDVLIPYVLIKDTKDVFNFIEKYEKVLLKPTVGNQGRNIIVIQKVNDMYKLIDNNSNKLYSYSEIFTLLNKKYLNSVYICQKFIESKTKEDTPFDIRLHVRKNEKGQWKKVKIYPKIGIGKTLLPILVKEAEYLQ